MQHSVLLIEDDQDLSELTRVALEEAEYTVQHSRSVTEAVTRSERQAFDCIALDLRLEKGTGQQFLEYIRKNKKNPNNATPVIITSGYLDPHLVQDLKGMVDSVLIKPYTQEQLIQRIQALIEKDQKKKSQSA